ncbi:MAG: hypothetical protein HYR64_03810 [Fimbriimonas ginsengisoli]|uniref:Uncharacterized protein n=1 Tax=Fimbriimonas ginsengisoli TaxID=1005039 RepID=A0A931LRM8_FIMGI|nr:hypothetical protein [Fimbriimonas ginsengisoli]
MLLTFLTTPLSEEIAMTFTVEFTPDAAFDQAVEAFAKAYGYQAALLDDDGASVPNPEGAGAHFVRRVREFIVETVRAAGTQTVTPAEPNLEIRPI